MNNSVLVIIAFLFIVLFFLFLFLFLKIKKKYEYIENVKSIEVFEEKFAIINLEDDLYGKDAFFIDLKVDRSQSYREAFEKAGIAYKEQNKNLFELLLRNDKKSVRLYFIKVRHSGLYPKMNEVYDFLLKYDLKPDPFAYLRLFEINKDLCPLLEVSCIWKIESHNYVELDIVSNNACIYFRSKNYNFDSTYICGVKK